MAPRVRLRPRPLPGLCSAVVLVGLLVFPSHSRAEHDPEYRDEIPDRPDGVHVLDGSYVMDMGRLHVNVTNHGLIGSQYTLARPYSWAPSGQWPGGSGDEYLWGAGLWVGAKVAGQIGVTTGQPERELRPDAGVLDTIYESRNHRATRPWAAASDAGWRIPDPRADDDGDGLIDEDPLTGHDDDGDGLIDEDFGQIGDQMFTASMSDDLALVQEIYPGHLPLGLRVHQRTATFYREDMRDVVIVEYEIINAGIHDLEEVYLGFYVDCDIQRRGDLGSQPDDLAGMFSGPVRDTDGTYYNLEVAWMKDAAEDDPLSGWFGTLLVDHETDFSGTYAPPGVSVRSYQVFSTNASTAQQGEPKSDADRYTLMERNEFDPDRHPLQAGDLKYMISSGPFPILPPGRSLTYRLAFVIGDGKSDMMAKALRVKKFFRGREFDMDGLPITGFDGMEYKICVGDLPPKQDGSDPMFDYRYAYLDESCTGPDPVFGYERIARDGLITYPDGSECTFANADNCEECFRAMGEECTIENGLYWDFLNLYHPSTHPQYFTGLWGREHREPWIEFSETPPPPPEIRLVPGPKRVDVYWDDVSEHEPDYYRGVIDFESYRIWRIAGWTRAPGTSPGDRPPAKAWNLIDEFDVVNHIPESISYSGQRLNLGKNTGLEGVVYEPACLTDPRFAGLGEAMDAFVQADLTGEFTSRPPLRDSNGAVIPGREPLVPWEAYPAMLDTFFAVIPRDTTDGAVGKRSTRYYRYRDNEVADGFECLYSVVAADHRLAFDYRTWSFLPAGEGIQTEPANNNLATTPGPLAQTAENLEEYGRNIYVYPNPATREALAEFQQQPASIDDPTGVRVMFNNLPEAQNHISIFTTSGDLVATVEHDGRHDIGAASWNLVSRNGQEVVSGIYLYTVQSDDDGFPDFQGRFVVIR